MKKILVMLMCVAMVIALMPAVAFANEGNGGTSTCTPTSHTPGSEPNQPNYTSCGGGYEKAYYSCQYCDAATDQYGKEFEWSDATDKHTLGSEQYDPTYTPCRGGFKHVWYECTVCGNPTDKDGKPAEWTDATAAHTPSLEKYDADFTPCGGGHKVDYYICTVCYCPFDENGQEIEWSEPNTTKHTPDLTKKHEADYIPCLGGYKDAYYFCSYCEAVTDADGNELSWSEATTDIHTPSAIKNAADYTTCAGGYKTDWYFSSACWMPVNEDGREAEWSEPTAKHKPGTKKYAADYTACGGGHKSDYYICSVCGYVTDQDGTDLYYINACDLHTFVDGKCAVCSAVDPDAPTHTPIDTTKPVKDIAVGVAKDDVKAVEKVANDEAKAILEAVKAGKVDELKKNDIVDKKVIDAIVNAPAGSDVKVTTNVAAKPVEKSAVDEKTVALVVKGADNSTVVQYLDLSVMMNVVVDGTVVETGEIKQLSKPITFTIAVPEELKTVREGMERTYYVIRVHGDEVTKLPVTVNEDGTLSFQTDRFSTYALAYEDTAKTTTTPKTGDATNMLPWLALMTVAGAGAVVLRKKETDK